MIIQLLFISALTAGNLSVGNISRPDIATIIKVRTEVLHVHRSWGDIVRIAEAVKQAEYIGPPVELLLAVIEQESVYRINARNGNGRGLMQIEPIVLRELRHDGRRLSPEDNVKFGAIYLNMMYHRYHHWGRALTAYNKGSRGLRRDHYRVSYYARRVIYRWKRILLLTGF